MSVSPTLEAQWLDLISGRAPQWWAGAARFGLGGLALPYAAGISAYRALFDFGLIRPGTLPCPVVSIGNITVGGTGKTTTARWLVRRLASLGRVPAILSRGYGAPAASGGATAVVADRKRVRLVAPQGGDEPVLLARSLPGVPVLVGKRRLLTGQQACRELGADVVVLDDAFQYWRLRKDVEIVLIDAVNPFGYGAVFPRGQLREPLRGLRRADAVLITHADWVTPHRLEQLRSEVIRHRPGAVMGATRHAAVQLRDLATGAALPLDHLRDGRRRLAFSGLGQPEAFARTLRDIGAVGIESRAFPDHHRYAEADVAHLTAAAGNADLVTTEKDAVKIQPGWLGDNRCLVLEVDLEFLEGEAALDALLREKLHP